MRILPDNPSVDFLRKEAKDLRAALRESRPDASLADAQRALAVEYGMRDWAELKAEAERRAAEAPVAPEGLAEALATAFGLGRVTGPATAVSYTPMGRCWSITTDRGRWLAGTVWDIITEEQAEVGARLRDAAVAAGITAPAPVRSPEGRLIEPVHGQSWRVHEWIEVGPSPVVPTPTAVARRAGAILGTLHTLAIPSQAPIPPHLVARRPEAAWHALVDEARAAGKPWADQLADVLPTLLDLRTIEASVDADEFILCNRNVIPEQVRLGHNDELVVTGWDLVGSLTPELEAGYTLTHWMLQPSVNPKGAAAFREGYVDAAGQWPELELASFAVSVTGWLNWTYDRICASINSADDDHAAYSAHETADLLERPMTRALLQELLAAVDTNP